MVGHWTERTGILVCRNQQTVEPTNDTSRPTMTGRLGKQERRKAPASPATTRRVDGN